MRSSPISILLEAAHDARFQTEARGDFSGGDPGRTGRRRALPWPSWTGQERSPEAETRFSGQRGGTAQSHSRTSFRRPFSGEKTRIPAPAQRPRKAVAVDETTAVIDLFKLAMQKEKEAEEFYRDSKARMEDAEQQEGPGLSEPGRAQPLFHAQVRDRPARDDSPNISTSRIFMSVRISSMSGRESGGTGAGFCGIRAAPAV